MSLCLIESDTKTPLPSPGMEGVGGCSYSKNPGVCGDGTRTGVSERFALRAASDNGGLLPCLFRGALRMRESVVSGSVPG